MIAKIVRKNLVSGKETVTDIDTVFANALDAMESLAVDDMKANGGYYRSDTIKENGNDVHRYIVSDKFKQDVIIYSLYF